MSETPIGWYKWYARDFLASTTVRRMSITAQGVYRALLDVQWEDGMVPANYAEAMGVIRATRPEGKAFEPFFETCFPGGKNSRLDYERCEAVRFIERQREAGTASAKAKKAAKSGSNSTVVKPVSNQTEKETKTKTETKKQKEVVVSSELIDLLYTIPAVARFGRRTLEIDEEMKKITNTYPWVTNAFWIKIAKSAIDGAKTVAAWTESGSGVASPNKVLELQIEHYQKHDRFPKPPKPDREEMIAKRTEPIDGTDFRESEGIGRLEMDTSQPFDEAAWRVSRGLDPKESNV